MPRMPKGGGGRARRLAPTPVVGMQCRVLASTRTRANAVADRLGVTMGRYVELLVERDQLDANGRPLWAAATVPPRPEPATAGPQRQPPAKWGRPMVDRRLVRARMTTAHADTLAAVAAAHGGMDMGAVMDALVAVGLAHLDEAELPDKQEEVHLTG